MCTLHVLAQNVSNMASKQKRSKVKITLLSCHTKSHKISPPHLTHPGWHMLTHTCTCTCTGSHTHGDRCHLHWSGGQPITAPGEHGGTVPCSMAPQLVARRRTATPPAVSSPIFERWEWESNLPVVGRPTLTTETQPQRKAEMMELKCLWKPWTKRVKLKTKQQNNQAGREPDERGTGIDDERNGEALTKTEIMTGAEILWRTNEEVSAAVTDPLETGGKELQQRVMHEDWKPKGSNKLPTEKRLRNQDFCCFVTFNGRQKDFRLSTVSCS